MPLNISIFLPKETVYEIDQLQDFFVELGDLIARDFGTGNPEENEFNLEDLNSFFIIEEKELPDITTFEETDMYLVIPVSEDNNE